MREELSALQHDIWSHWMKYLFSVCRRENGDALIIPADKVQRWSKQMNTPYSELTEKEKESDRDQADKVIDLITHHSSKEANKCDFEKWCLFEGQPGCGIGCAKYSPPA